MVDRFLTEMPHIKVSNDDYIDLELEDIILEYEETGDRQAVKRQLYKNIANGLKNVKDKQSAIKEIRKDSTLVAALVKFFDMGREDLEEILNVVYKRFNKKDPKIL